MLSRINTSYNSSIEINFKESLIDPRIKSYQKMSDYLNQLNDEEILTLLHKESFNHARWGKSSIIEIDGTKIFVKKLL